jgi:mannitol/fructose-specific phosphotransferase system IIA component (Ntr-type)
MGVSNEGVNVKSSANTVHIILILVSPVSVDKQEHLKNLNAVIKKVRTGDAFENLRTSTDPQNSMKAFLQGNHQSLK